MKKFRICIFGFTATFSFLFSYAQPGTIQTDLTEYVNPFIGTGGHGHTFPGASVPFGMVQLSPDTRLTGWDGCSAYHYSDSIIYGFSHTHLSGTGCSDYGDILFMPVNGDFSITDYGYASSFKHKNEKASAGYYSVILDRSDIQVELTATARAGMHRYTFSGNSEQKVVIDLKHRDQVLDSYVKIVNKSEIKGFRKSKAWAEEQYVYFDALFNKSYKKIELFRNDSLIPFSDSISGTNLKIILTFDPSGNKELIAKCGISGVSTDGASKNVRSEIPGWDFQEVCQKAKGHWNKELGKIIAEGGTNNQLITFYTALYHCMLQPNLYMDVDSLYRGRDLKIHKAISFDYYTVFSLWDTYRAEHPLFTIIDQKRTNDFINTFLAQYDQVGKLPVWELSGNETDCMIGFHSASVIADALVKGIRNFDVTKALLAMKNSALKDTKGYAGFVKYGYVPGSDYNESVSKTLEFAYDDWCIAQVTKNLENVPDYKQYIRQAQYYKNIYDSSTGFMRPKINNAWYSPFNPTEVTFHFTEANAWQYNFYVPQDIKGFCKIAGGKEKLSEKLDSLFTTTEKLSGRDQSDITGLIGQYAHGNEPSHHIAYLYDYLGKPYKTQEMIHRIIIDMYNAKPDGLSGNEDCGQMSAWFVMSALGFYPVCPGQLQYAIGTPLFPKVTIHLENGKTFIITAPNLSASNFYIQSSELNSKNYNNSYLLHDDLMNGGALNLVMGSSPNKSWGSCEKCIPSTEINDFPIVTVPRFEYQARSFTDSMQVSIKTDFPDLQIFYTTDGSTPDSTKSIYIKPLILSGKTTLKAVCYSKSNEYSNVQELAFIKKPANRSVTLTHNYSLPYSGGGPEGLLDMIRGGTSFMSEAWQGYQGTDFEAVISLGSSDSIHKISAGFLQSIGSWIWMPVYVEFYISDDGKNYTLLGKIMNKVSEKEYTTTINDLVLEKKAKATYVKVVAKNYGTIPDWHLGAGGEAYIFIDEITIE
jgi:predicted alpha-1,2-mannosidase